LTEGVAKSGKIIYPKHSSEQQAQNGGGGREAHRRSAPLAALRTERNQQVRRGVYHDVPELIAAIDYFIENYYDRAKPLIWTKTPEHIMTKATKQQATSRTLR
jgi:hypothetical protein